LVAIAGRRAADAFFRLAALVRVTGPWDFAALTFVAGRAADRGFALASVLAVRALEDPRVRLGFLAALAETLAFGRDDFDIRFHPFQVLGWKPLSRISYCLVTVSR
jgi:hypothetical protein